MGERIEREMDVEFRVVQQLHLPIVQARLRHQDMRRRNGSRTAAQLVGEAKLSLAFAIGDQITQAYLPQRRRADAIDRDTPGIASPWRRLEIDAGRPDVEAYRRGADQAETQFVPKQRPQHDVAARRIAPRAPQQLARLAVQLQPMRMNLPWPQRPRPGPLRVKNLGLAIDLGPGERAIEEYIAAHQVEHIQHTQQPQQSTHGCRRYAHQSGSVRGMATQHGESRVTVQWSARSISASELHCLGADRQAFTGDHEPAQETDGSGRQCFPHCASTLTGMRPC
jgi:hypothetical protein